MRGGSFLSKLAVEVVTEAKNTVLQSCCRERGSAFQASAVHSYVKPPTKVTKTLLCLLSHTFLFSKGSDGMFALSIASSHSKVQNADGGQMQSSGCFK